MEQKIRDAWTLADDLARRSHGEVMQVRVFELIFHAMLAGTSFHPLPDGDIVTAISTLSANTGKYLSLIVQALLTSPSDEQADAIRTEIHKLAVSREPLKEAVERNEPEL